MVAEPICRSPLAIRSMLRCAASMSSTRAGGDQLLAWLADGTAVLPPDAFTGLCQERRGIQHRIPPC
jgi:hypothetical protein